MAICIVVKSGHDRGKKFTVKKNDMVIGRDSSADISLNDQTVSREHCRIRTEKDRILLEDLNSSNNTYLNGKIVRSCTTLSLNDEILIGETVLSVSDCSTSVFSRSQPKTMMISTHDKSIDKLSSELELRYKGNSAIV